MDHNAVVHGGHQPNGHVRVTTYRAGKPESKVVPEEEGRRIVETGEWDFVHDLVHTETRVRKQDGSVVRHNGPIRGIGPAPQTLLLKLMRLPGRYLRPYEVGRMKPEYESHYVRDCLIAMVSRLRKRIFQETGREPYFLLTDTPFAVAYNAELSYCLIERPDSDLDVD